jgi:flagellar motor switch protein FliM
VDDLMRLEEGQVLFFDYPVKRPVDLLLNGNHKFMGYPATTGRKKAFEIIEPYRLFELAS